MPVCIHEPCIMLKGILGMVVNSYRSGYPFMANANGVCQNILISKILFTPCGSKGRLLKAYVGGLTRLVNLDPHKVVSTNPSVRLVLDLYPTT